MTDEIHMYLCLTFPGTTVSFQMCTVLALCEEKHCWDMRQLNGLPCTEQRDKMLSRIHITVVMYDWMNTSLFYPTDLHSIRTSKRFTMAV